MKRIHYSGAGMRPGHLHPVAGVETTDDPGKVTCRTCLRQIGGWRDRMYAAMSMSAFLAGVEVEPPDTKGLNPEEITDLAREFVASLHRGVHPWARGVLDVMAELLKAVAEAIDGHDIDEVSVRDVLDPVRMTTKLPGSPATKAGAGLLGSLHVELIRYDPENGRRLTRSHRFSTVLLLGLAEPHPAVRVELDAMVADLEAG